MGLKLPKNKPIFFIKSSDKQYNFLLSLSADKGKELIFIAETITFRKGKIR